MAPDVHVQRTVRALFICAFAVAPLCAQNLNEVLARLDRSSKGFTAMTADIRQTAHTAIVNDDSIENGTIRLKRLKGETRLLVDFTNPDAKTVSISGGEVSIYLPKAKTVQIVDLRSKKSVLEQGLLLGFGASSAELKAAYEVTWIGQETLGGQPTGHIHLLPKSADVLRNIKGADLWISDSLGVPVQQKVLTSGTGDYTLMQYSNIKVNPAIADKDLKLNVPKGVQVQQIGK